MVRQNIVDRFGAEGGMELFKMLLRQRGIHSFDDIHPGQRTNGVNVGARSFDDPFPGTEFFLIGKFQVGPGLNTF